MWNDIESWEMGFLFLARDIESSVLYTCTQLTFVAPIRELCTRRVSQDGEQNLPTPLCRTSSVASPIFNPHFFRTKPFFSNLGIQLFKFSLVSIYCFKVKLWLI